MLNANHSLDADNTSNYNNTTLYTGRTLDAQTGLYYYRARIYAPHLGTFVPRDPIGYQAGDDCCR